MLASIKTLAQLEAESKAATVARRTAARLSEAAARVSSRSAPAPHSFAACVGPEELSSNKKTPHAADAADRRRS